MRVCGEVGVLPSSINLPRPFTKNTIAEYLDMLMVCYYLYSRIPEDVAFTESGIYPENTHGIAHEVGSFVGGKLADMVIWKSAFFGVKPQTIIKGGFITWANVNAPNAPSPTLQPTIYLHQLGAFGRSLASTLLTFVSAISLESGGLEKGLSSVKGCRTVKKRDLTYNDVLPKITVDPET